MLFTYFYFVFTWFVCGMFASWVLICGCYNVFYWFDCLFGMIVFVAGLLLFYALGCFLVVWFRWCWLFDFGCGWLC